MLNTKFEAYKISRELKRSGTEFIFRRPKLNEFNEPTKESKVICVVTGLYHEQNFHVSATTGNTQNNTTQVRTKKMPMILCLYEDIEPFKLQVGDQVEVGSHTYRVIDIANIQEWGIIADISLEVINVGIHA